MAKLYASCVPSGSAAPTLVGSWHPLPLRAPCSRLSPRATSPLSRSWGSSCRFLSQDWPFDDGAPPPGKVVEDWLSLVKAKFCEAPGSCVAVHCVAGLGR